MGRREIWDRGAEWELWGRGSGWVCSDDAVKRTWLRHSESQVWPSDAHGQKEGLSSRRGVLELLDCVGIRNVITERCDAAGGWHLAGRRHALHGAVLHSLASAAIHGIDIPKSSSVILRPLGTVHDTACVRAALQYLVEPAVLLLHGGVVAVLGRDVGPAHGVAEWWEPSACRVALVAHHPQAPVDIVKVLPNTQRKITVHSEVLHRRQTPESGGKGGRGGRHAVTCGSVVYVGITPRVPLRQAAPEGCWVASGQASVSLPVIEANSVHVSPTITHPTQPGLAVQSVQHWPLPPVIPTLPSVRLKLTPPPWRVLGNGAPVKTTRFIVSHSAWRMCDRKFHARVVPGRRPVLEHNSQCVRW
jgi:hypothetical protein